MNLGEIVETLFIPGVRGVSIVGVDGLEIVSKMGAGLDPEVVGALIAKTAKEIEKNLVKIEKPILVYLHTTDGRIFFEVAESFIVVVVANRDVNAGAVRLKLQRVLPFIEEMLSS